MTTQRPRKPSPVARHERALVRREQLLATALELFSTHGYAATSTKKIAVAAGVTEGLVFHYFPTKLDLLLEIATRRHTFAGRILVVLDSLSNEPARVVLRQFAAGFAGVSREEARFIGVMQAESQVNEELRTTFAGTTALVIERIAAYLATRVRAGELRDDVPLVDMVHGFFGGFSFFFTQHRQLEGAAWSERAEGFARAWADTCWRGLARPEHITE
ncbi:TetR/AcrR family transcriptional regulator [Nannocystaceae bacterium ST9]